jgi:hypothetical protein
LKKNQLKKDKKTNNSIQLGLTCQNCNPGHVIRITPYKKIKKTYETQFSINSILKDEIEKKISIKKNLSQPGLTSQTCDLNNETEIT